MRLWAMLWDASQELSRPLRIAVESRKAKHRLIRWLV
jgi:hypothetical protein